MNRFQFHVVVAATLAASVATALAQDGGTVWAGSFADQGRRPIAVQLRYVGDLPVVRFSDPYACQFGGAQPAASDPQTTVYTVVRATGGRCDTMLGGRLEIGAPSASPSRRSLRAFSTKGEKRFEATVTMVQ